jgi:hypothetical protein
MRSYHRGVVVTAGATLAIFLLASSAYGQGNWRLDGALTFNRFEQQIKTEVGGAKGDRLVEETAVGLGVSGAYRIWGPLSVGLYARYDVGSRFAGEFDHFDADNKPVVDPEVGGSYSELWMGPMIRAHWRTLFFEFGHGTLGMRWDDARGDLKTENQADPDAPGSGALHVMPTVAWLAALGGGFPINDELELVLRLEYRVRYYNRRDEALIDETVHGTQNFTPFAGLCWKFGGGESFDHETQSPDQ